MSGSWSHGKGDKDRTANRSAYEAGWERVFGVPGTTTDKLIEMDRYQSKTACAASGMTYRQLDYLIRATDLMAPEVGADGKGTDRYFSFRDLVALRCIGNLRASGVNIQATRKVGTALRAYGRDFTDAHLVLTASEVYVRDRGELLALLESPGQGAWATIVDLGRCAEEVTEVVASVHNAAVSEMKRAAPPKRGVA